MQVRYRYRFYPTQSQEVALARVFGCCRYVYNRALAWRKEAWAERGEKVGFVRSSAELTKWKRNAETEWLSEVSCVPLQQSLRHLDAAYGKFFRKEARYPQFKKRGHRQSATYTRFGFRLRKPDPKNPNLVVSGLGRLAVKWSRSFASEPSSVTIAREPSGKYFVSLVLDEVFAPLPATGTVVGVDLGVSCLATTSDGQRIPNPKLTAKNQGRLARAQRTLARRVKVSGRWHAQRVRVARIHERVGWGRKDALDKATTGLVRRYDSIAIEDLNVRGMVKNRCLSKAISDAAFGQFRAMLEYKCERYGRGLEAVDRFFPSSKKCSNEACGHILESLSLGQRTWVCPECGQEHDREDNAAKTISAEGHSVAARGAGVRRARTLVRGRSRRGSVNHLGIGRANS